MLRVQARLADGEWREIAAVTRSGEPPTASALLDAARVATSDSPEAGAVFSAALGYLDARTPGLCALREWGEEARDQFISSRSERERLEQPNPDSLAWLDGDELVALIWEHLTLAAVPIRSEYTAIAFEYELEENEVSIDEPLLKLTNRHILGGGWEPGFTEATLLDWQGFFGPGTFLTLGRSVLEKTRGGPRRAVIEVAGHSGLILGRVSTWIGRVSELDVDPCFSSRLAAHEKKWPETAKRCPNIAEGVITHAGGSAVVFIHGTVSCAVGSLERLGALSVPAFRYEHDTFQPITSNAEDLAKRIAVLGFDRILLAAHSRGGLVARWAAHLLRSNHYAGELFIWTLGTPHAGTPIVSASAPLGSLYMMAALADPAETSA